MIPGQFRKFRILEGKYSPRGADGKRIRRNVYAKTREECEKKLAKIIEEVTNAK